MKFKFLCVGMGVLLAGFVVAINAQEPQRKSDSIAQDTIVIDMSSGEQPTAQSSQLAIPENRYGNSKNV